MCWQLHFGKMLREQMSIITIETNVPINYISDMPMFLAELSHAVALALKKQEEQVCVQVP